MKRNFSRKGNFDSQTNRQTAEIGHLDTQTSYRELFIKLYHIYFVSRVWTQLMAEKPNHNVLKSPGTRNLITRSPASDFRVKWSETFWIFDENPAESSGFLMIFCMKTIPKFVFRNEHVPQIGPFPCSLPTSDFLFRKTLPYSSVGHIQDKAGATNQSCMEFRLPTSDFRIRNFHFHATLLPMQPRSIDKNGTLLASRWILEFICISRTVCRSNIHRDAKNVRFLSIEHDCIGSPGLIVHIPREQICVFALIDFPFSSREHCIDTRALQFFSDMNQDMLPPRKPTTSILEDNLEEIDALRAKFVSISIQI